MTKQICYPDEMQIRGRAWELPIIALIALAVIPLLHRFQTIPLCDDGWKWIGITIGVGVGGGLWSVPESIWGRFDSRTREYPE